MRFRRRRKYYPRARALRRLTLNEAFQRPGEFLVDDQDLWEAATTWDLQVRAAGTCVSNGTYFNGPALAMWQARKQLAAVS